MATKEFQESIDKLKEQISVLQKAIRSMKRTGLSENILYKAILSSANRYYKSTYFRKPITLKMIKAIVEGIENLEEYIFPPELKD